MRTDLPPKRPGEVAVRNCQPVKGVTILPFRFGDIRCTSADYTATMNKYGIHRIGGKNRRVPRTAQQQISFNATRAGKNSSTSRIYHTRRKAIKDRGIMDWTLTAIRRGFIPRSGSAPRTKSIKIQGKPRRQPKS